METNNSWAEQMGWNIRVVANKYKREGRNPYMEVFVGYKNVALLEYHSGTWNLIGDGYRPNMDCLTSSDYEAVLFALKEMGYAD